MLYLELTMHDPVQPHEHRQLSYNKLKLVIIALPNMLRVFGLILVYSLLY